MKNTPNIMPSEGDYAIIMVKNGILEIYTGNVNQKHDDLHIIEEFFISDNTVHIKAKKMKILEVNSKVTEHEGCQLSVNHPPLSYKDIIDMVKNPNDIIQTYYKERTWLMKLLGKPEIKYNYITLEDANCWGENKRHLILKPEYWTPKEYQSNTYTISKV